MEREIKFSFYIAISVANVKQIYWTCFVIQVARGGSFYTRLREYKALHTV